MLCSAATVQKISSDEKSMLLSIGFSLRDRPDEIVLFWRSNGQPAGWKNTLYRREKPLLRRRHGKLRALLDALGPALHDRLLLRIETHALFTVGMRIAEQAALPAAEAVPRHRHRNRHVDADHPDFDAAAEFTRDVTIAREARDAIAELVRIDQIDGFG